MKQPTIINNLFIKQDNVSGDNNLWIGADGPAQKIDGRLFVAALAVAAVAVVGSAVWGFMQGAMLWGAMIAPYVLGGTLAAGTGIGGFALYKRRVLAQPLPPIEDVPAVVIQAAPVVLPASQPRALRSAEVEELVGMFEADYHRPLKEYEIDHIEQQIIAQQPAAKILPLCAPSLPESQPSQPSAALPLPISYSA